MRFALVMFVSVALLGCDRPQVQHSLPTVDASQLAPEAVVAIDRATKAVLDNPSSASAWTTLGVHYQSHGLYDAAVEAYVAAQSFSKEPAQTAYWLGLSLAKLGRYEEAIAACSQYDRYVPAIWKQGYWLMDLGRIDEAADKFQNALQVDPNAVAAMVGLARVRLQQHRESEAIEMLENIQTLGGDHPYLSYLLGTAYQRAGREVEAEVLLLKPASAPPNWNDPWFAEMMGYQRGFAASIARATSKLDAGDPAGALSALQQLSKTHPRDPAVLTNLATVQLQMGQIDSAIQTCADSIRWSPEHAPSHLTMALALLRSGDLDRASTYCRNAIDLQPANAQAHSLAGRIALRGRLFAEAASQLEQAIAIGSNNLSDREVLGMVYLELRKYDLARIQFDLVLRVTPSATICIGGKAVALASAGNREEAMIILRRAMAKFPNDSNLQRALNAVAQQGSSQ